MKYQYIAIEGNIGAGKTTLAHKLSKDLGASIILEQFADNPFLEKFYENPERFVFKLETSFLMDRFNQLKENLHPTQGAYVSDYFFAKSLIFAKVNLSPEGFELFKNLYDIFSTQLSQPDLIIYLNNSTDNLQKNIYQRGRSYENNIEVSYLDRISESYESYLESISDIPVLYIDLSAQDILNISQKNNKGQTYYQHLWQAIQKKWHPGISYIDL